MIMKSSRTFPVKSLHSRIRNLNPGIDSICAPMAIAKMANDNDYQWNECGGIVTFVTGTGTGTNMSIYRILRENCLDSTLNDFNDAQCSISCQICWNIRFFLLLNFDFSSTIYILNYTYSYICISIYILI